MKQLEESLQYLQIQQDELLEKADEIISVYWAWFTDSNRNIIEQRNVGLTDLRTGSFAPLIQRKKSGEGKKAYIMWRKFDASSIRRVNPRFSTHINPSAAGDYLKSLSKASWELTKAVELENQLIPIRIAVNALHDSMVKMRLATRKISTLNTQQSNEVLYD